MPGLVVLVLLLLLGTAAAGPQIHPDMWWRNTQVQEAMHLTPQQVQRLEQIFYTDADLRIARRRTLVQLETQFAKALKAGDVDGIEESGLIDRMEELRALVNIRRSMMLMAMYQTLSADQRKALTDMHSSGRRARP